MSHRPLISQVIKAIMYNSGNALWVFTTPCRISTMCCGINQSRSCIFKLATHCEAFTTRCKALSMCCEISSCVVAICYDPYIASHKVNMQHMDIGNVLWDIHNALSGNPQRVVGLFLATHCRNPVFWLVNTATYCDILATHYDFFTTYCHNTLWPLWLAIHSDMVLERQ